MLTTSPRTGRRARLVTIAAQLLVVAVLVATGVVAHVAPAEAAGTVLLEDSFTDPTVASDEYVVGGSGFTPCLTAAGSGSSVPGRCADASDPSGSGALRLTPAVGGVSGFLLYDHPLPTKAGLDITFNMYQYGGTGADGISFFLTDGSQTLSQPGPAGGSLGYHTNGTHAGLANSLLGVGLDAYGNFSLEWNDPSCAVQNPGPRQTDQIAVRGPAGADRYSDYCLLAAPVNVAGGIDNTATSTRGPAEHDVRIVVDPPADTTPQVHVYLDGSLRTSVPQPAVLATTPTFKFGWAASTGGQTNVHEINFLQVQSVDPIQPELDLAAPASVTTDSGSTTNVTMTATVEADGGPESEPITLDLTAEPGAAFDGTPSGSGWACDAPVGSTASCTYTPGSPIVSGTTLPAVTVPVTSAGSGSFQLSGTLSSSDNANDVSASSAATSIVVRPVAAPAGPVAAVAHPTAPTAVTVQPAAPTGTGPFTYAIASAPAPGEGSASIDAATGEATFTPAAGASGSTSFTYTVTGADGVASQPATVTARTAPVAPDRSATTDHSSATTLAVPSTPVGSGPFTYAIAAAPAPAEGSATVDPSTGEITFTPAAGFSGVSSFSYTASDSDGIASAAADVEVTVRPAVGILTASVALDADGEGDGSSNAPTPSGDGPFTYALVVDPADGDASIDPSTGVVAYQAAAGVSGTFVARYTVTDGNGVTSPAQDVAITVHPYTSPVVGETDADTPVVLDTPATLGSSPFSYSVTPPAGMAATIAADGTVTFDPHGHSGEVAFSYEATDADGVTSGPVAVTVTVRPVVPDIAGHGTADPDAPATVTLAAAPTGDGPFTYEIVDGLASGVGTAVATATGVELRPSAGVSGSLVATYRVVDGDGVASAPATATVELVPVATSGSVRAPSGQTTDVPFPAPVGTGPFTCTIVDGMAAGTGTAEVLPSGELRIEPDPAYSGVRMLTYTVTDGDGLRSAPQTLELTVAPYAADEQMPPITASTRVAPSPVAFSPADPAGAGPFTYEIVGQPNEAVGRAVIDRDTGRIVFTPAAGASGRGVVTYVVTDVNGVRSDPIAVTARVVPAATAPNAPKLRASAVGTDTITITPQDPVGTGPFTYEVASAPDPAHGSVTIDPMTGEMRFTAADGYAGTVSFSYRVIDADGLVSDAITVTVDVAAPPPATLPVTGGELLRLVLVGAALAAAGAVATFAARRRTS